MIVNVGIFISTLISVTSVNCYAIDANQQEGYDYQSWAPKKFVNYFDNPYVSAEVEDESNAKDVFLSFHKPVHKDDNFQLTAKFTNEDGQMVSEVVKIMNLCDFLEAESETNAPFSYSSILGMAGLRCPIIVGDVKEMIDVKPFKWPEQHSFAEKINCGVHTYQSTLYKCDDQGNNCQKLLEAGVESLMTSRHCDDDEDKMSESPPVFEDEDCDDIFDENNGNKVEVTQSYGNDEMNEVNKMDGMNQYYPNDEMTVVTDGVTENYKNYNKEDEYNNGIDAINHMNVDKVSATNDKIVNTKIQQTERLDADLSTGQIIGTKSNKVAVVDGEINQIKLVDSNSGQEVKIVDGKIDHVDLFDQKQNAMEPDYEHKDNVYDSQPQVTVSQVKTKDDAIKHHETTNDIGDEDRMQETEMTEDELTDAILKNIRVVTAQNGQRHTMDTISGQRVRHNDINGMSSDLNMKKMY